jgi:hypothetical protein
MGVNPVPEWWIGLRFVIVLLAGREAEIRQAQTSKKSTMLAYLGSGSDFEQVEEIKKRFDYKGFEKKIFMFKAEKEVKKFVADYWQPINALADLIRTREIILGTDPEVTDITGKIEPLPMEQEIATEWVLKPNFGFD